MPRNKLSAFDLSARKEIASNLKRNMHGMTQAELAEKSGIPLTTLSGYLREKSTPDAGNLEKLANALNINKSDIDPRYAINDIMDFVVNEPKGTYKFPKNTNHLYKSSSLTKDIPLIGEIACGDPITAEENIEEYITHVFPKDQVPSGDLIDLRAKGHSMEPTIPDGSIVTVRLQPEVEDGEIAAVQVNGDTEATLKRVKHINGLVMLKPDNDAYDPIIITPKNPARIIGKAIQFTSKL